MSDYRRWYVPGGTFFFTVVAYDRRPILTTDAGRTFLRSSIESVRARHPFTLVATALLPNHVIPPQLGRFVLTPCRSPSLGSPPPQALATRPCLAELSNVPVGEEPSVFIGGGSSETICLEQMGEVYRPSDGPSTLCRDLSAVGAILGGFCGRPKKPRCRQWANCRRFLRYHSSSVLSLVVRHRRDTGHQGDGCEVVRLQVDRHKIPVDRSARNNHALLPEPPARPPRRSKPR